MKCELCAYSVDACRTAARLGVHRVELCASPAEGGTTPSLASIEQACAIKGIDVSVMIRPRGGDFLYTDEEFQIMLRDIEHARQAGATGVVFGILTSDGKVDIERTRQLVEAAQISFFNESISFCSSVSFLLTVVSFEFAILYSATG